MSDFFDIEYLFGKRIMRKVNRQETFYGIKWLGYRSD